MDRKMILEKLVNDKLDRRNEGRSDSPYPTAAQMLKGSLQLVGKMSLTYRVTTAYRYNYFQGSLDQLMSQFK